MDGGILAPRLRMLVDGPVLLKEEISRLPNKIKSVAFLTAYRQDMRLAHKGEHI